MNPVAVTIAVAALVLSGCAAPLVGPNAGQVSAPRVVEGIWLRTDGRSGRDDPVIAQQFEVDKAACMVGAEPDPTCMQARGYLLVPAAQVETRAAQLRAAAGSQ
jgi:hypothetical protein